MENQNQEVQEVQATNANVASFYFREPTAAMIKANSEEGLPAPIRRATVEVEMPFLTADDVVKLLQSDAQEDAKAKELIVAQVNAVLIAEVRSQLDDMPNYADIDVSAIDFTKVDFVTLANTPRATRSGGGIEQATWDAFEANFKEVIAVHTETKPEAINTLATILVKRLKDVSRAEAPLKTLKEYLDIYYVNASPEAQVEFSDIYERLTKRIEGYLTSLSSNPLAIIGL